MPDKSSLTINGRKGVGSGLCGTTRSRKGGVTYKSIMTQEITISSLLKAQYSNMPVGGSLSDVGILETW